MHLAPQKGTSWGGPHILLPVSLSVSSNYWGRNWYMMCVLAGLPPTEELYLGQQVGEPGALLWGAQRMCLPWREVRAHICQTLLYIDGMLA